MEGSGAARNLRPVISSTSSSLVFPFNDAGAVGAGEDVWDLATADTKQAAAVIAKRHRNEGELISAGEAQSSIHLTIRTANRPQTNNTVQLPPRLAKARSRDLRVGFGPGFGELRIHRSGFVFAFLLLAQTVGKAVEGPAVVR